MLNCRIFNSQLGPTILDTVLVDDLRANDLILVWAPLFRHVTLRGTITSLKINDAPHPLATPEMRDRFLQDANAFYESVDWALDITEAKLSTFEVAGIPPRLIRFDPKYALLVTREAALSPSWRSGLSNWNRHWPWVIDSYLADGRDSFLLVAPRKRKELRDGLAELRRLGL
jgi:hypothetical protein